MGKSALVHEWFAAHGGSENVAELLWETLDEPDVYCLWREDEGRITRARLFESPLARSKLFKGRKAASLPVMPLIWRTLDFSRYDTVVISSHAFAHHAARAKNPDTRFFVYVHTPARYVWEPELDPRGDGLVARTLSRPLRGIDRRSVNRRAHFAANSDFVRRRMARTWAVDAAVIHPPVDVQRIQNRSWHAALTSEEAGQLESLPPDFVLGASRFVSYKQVDRAIDVGCDLDLPVVLAGGGPDRQRLASKANAASVPVLFVESPSTPMLYALYESASLYVFAAIEDFGIMPVEAMAAGTPVLVNELGGAREGVELVDGGIATSFEDVASRGCAAVEAIQLDRSEIRDRARRLDRSAFVESVGHWLDLPPRTPTLSEG